MFDITSVFPQTMDGIHRKILQINQEYLVQYLDVKRELCAQLVQNGVFTASMMDELQVC